MTKVKVRIPGHFSLVTFKKKEDETFKGELIGIFQYAAPIGESPLVGGHKGGVNAYPVAVVKYKNKLREVRLEHVEYVD